MPIWVNARGRPTSGTASPTKERSTRPRALDGDGRRLHKLTGEAVEPLRFRANIPVDVPDTAFRRTAG
jgi:hypothetical protein